jgi:radical SAM superfamily enzyme YgiQ (UPF0313 family)
VKYEGIVIRPPSEAGSLILQVTLGCSHNKCTFCPTYKSKKFRIRDIDSIQSNINEAKEYGFIRRVFLADGDALIIPRRLLLPIFDSISDSFPSLERIGIYGNAKSVLKKTTEELIELKERGLGIIYLGLESGDAKILERVKKGVGPDKMIAAAKRVKDTGILLSVTVLLGLGEVENSHRHARETGRVLSAMDPDYIGALTLMLVEGTPLSDEYHRGEFTLPKPLELLDELGVLLQHTHVSHCLFTSNHASNYLPLRIKLPEEKEEALSIIQSIVKNGDHKLLRPEFMRGL